MACRSSWSLPFRRQATQRWVLEGSFNALFPSRCPKRTSMSRSRRQWYRRNRCPLRLRGVLPCYGKNLVCRPFKSRDATHIPGTLVISIGDSLSQWTNKPPCRSCVPIAASPVATGRRYIQVNRAQGDQQERRPPLLDSNVHRCKYSRRG